MRRSISVSINDELLQLLDSYCDTNYMTRSQALTSAFVTVYRQQEAVSALNKVTSLLRDAVNSGQLSEDDRKEVERLEKKLDLLSD